MVSWLGFDVPAPRVTVAGAGEGVLAAVLYAFDEDGVRDGYSYVDGTSFSSPMVAAATAWVRQERPGLDGTQVTELIRGAARDLGPTGWDPSFGFGAFHLPTALTARAPRRDYLEPNDDIEWIDGRRFERPDRPVLSGSGRFAFWGTIDQLEDPVDVYSFRMRPPIERAHRHLPRLWRSRSRSLRQERKLGIPAAGLHRGFEATRPTHRRALARQLISTVGDWLCVRLPEAAYITRSQLSDQLPTGALRRLACCGGSVMAKRACVDSRSNSSTVGLRAKRRSCLSRELTPGLHRHRSVASGPTRL